MLRTRSSDQKKSTPTLLCSHLSTVRTLSQDACEQEALLEEISTSHAKLSLDCPVQAGSDVQIDCGTCEFRGKVSACAHWPGIDGYMAEVTFSEDAQWQPSTFKPDRLFNPNFLVCGKPGCTSDCVNENCSVEAEAEAPLAVRHAGA